MNMPVVEINGYEADDLIGTLAVKAAHENFECYIVYGAIGLYSFCNDISL